MWSYHRFLPFPFFWSMHYVLYLLLSYLTNLLNLKINVWNGYILLYLESWIMPTDINLEACNSSLKNVLLLESLWVLCAYFLRMLVILWSTVVTDASLRILSFVHIIGLFQSQFVLLEVWETSHCLNTLLILWSTSKQYVTSTSSLFIWRSFVTDKVMTNVYFKLKIYDLGS